MDNDDPVRGDETLYRAMLNTEKIVRYTYSEGQYKITSQAFFDRSLQPSVGRAELTKCDPALFLSRSNLDEKSGVVSLNAGVVCEIDLELHTVKVKPAPEDGDPGHAKIIMIPKLCCISNKKRKSEFSDLREALADIANESLDKNDWALEPKQ